MRTIILSFFAFFLLLMPWKNVCVAQDPVNPYGDHKLPAETIVDGVSSGRSRIAFSPNLATYSAASWTITVTTTKAPANAASEAMIFQPVQREEVTGGNLYDVLRFRDKGSSINVGGTGTLALNLETGDLPVGTPITLKIVANNTDYAYIYMTAGGRIASRTIGPLNSSASYGLDIYAIQSCYLSDVNVNIKNSAETMLTANASGSLNFSTTPHTPSANTNLDVAIVSRQGNISYVLNGANPGVFTVTPVTAVEPGQDEAWVWSPEKGGRLAISYKPTEAGEHTAQIEISSPGVETRKFSLSGTCKFPNFELSPTIIPSAADKWYFFYNPWRGIKSGGNVLSDVDGKLTQTLVTGTNNDAQLWKIVDPDKDGHYVFVNKATGNKIDCSEATNNAAENPVLTSATASSTFRFYQGTGWNAGYWVINCWEKNASINKSTNSALYAVYGAPAADDLGNGIAFFKEGDKELLIKDWEAKTADIKLSTNENEYWYRMQFRNRALTSSVVDRGSLPASELKDL